MKTIVTGVIGADAHIIGNRIMQKFLEAEGFKVISLGALTPPEEFIKAAVETAADAIAISSLYGHGELDCQGFRESCEEAGLQGIKLYIGGNLVVGAVSWNEVEKRFKVLGFDRIYPATVNMKEFIRDIKNDLGVADNE